MIDHVFTAVYDKVIIATGSFATSMQRVYASEPYFYIDVLYCGIESIAE